MLNSDNYKKSSHSAISEKKQEILLRISTNDAAAEIFILNHRLELKARGIGAFFEKKLPPGIYKIKVRTGSQIKEELVSLSGESKIVEKIFKQLEIVSAAPIVNTAKTHEYHIDNAKLHSLRSRVHVRVGKGSLIYLFARCWASKELDDYQRPIENPAIGLTLHSEKGELIADIGRHSSKSSNERDPWAACLIGVKPGCYRLRLELANGTQIEQTIATIRDWQTQVFFLQHNYGTDEKSDWRADLAGASILMSKSNRGFNPQGDDLRLDELTRLALTNNRKILSNEIRERLLHGKFKNPLFGVYGAHLLLMDKTPDRDLLNVVVDNLRYLAGEKHPDVEALALRVKGESKFIYTIPPMLRRSWAIVIEKTVDQSNLVPANSLAAEISMRIWGTEPFLRWVIKSPNDPKTKKQNVLIKYEQALIQRLKHSENLLSTRSGSDLKIATRGMLNDITDLMLDDITELFNETIKKGKAYLQMEVREELMPELIKSLGLPRAAVERLIKNVKKSDYK